MLLMSAGAFAQISVGKKFLGGSLQFSYSESASSSRYREGGISPLLGFSVSDKWALGPVLGYSNQRSSAESSGFKSTYKSNLGEVGIFGRRYIPLSGNIYFFAHGQLSYGKRVEEGFSNSNGFESTTKANIDMARLAVRPGIAYFPTPKWCIEGTFGKLGYDYSSTGSNVYNSPKHSVGLNLGAFAFSLSRFFWSLETAIWENRAFAVFLCNDG